jgi:hypothetical protein
MSLCIDLAARNNVATALQFFCSPLFSWMAMSDLCVWMMLWWRGQCCQLQSYSFSCFSRTELGSGLAFIMMSIKILYLSALVVFKIFQKL